MVVAAAKLIAVVGAVDAVGNMRAVPAAAVVAEAVAEVGVVEEAEEVVAVATVIDIDGREFYQYCLLQRVR